MTRLELAARALWEDREQHQHPRTRQTWEQGSDLARKFAMDHARAVIASLKDPPEVVCRGAMRLNILTEDDHLAFPAEAADIFDTMLDAILAEEQ